MHDPALKITEIYFQQKLLEITDLLSLILEMSIHDYVKIFITS